MLVLAVTYALVAQQMPREPGLTVSNDTRAGDPTVEHGQAPDGGPPPEDGNQQLIQFVQDTQDDALQAVLTQGGIALAVVGAATIGFGWLLAGRLLHPLQQVTETARRIADAPAADRSLHERIALDGPRDEVRELADMFDVMLGRLDQSFDGQRRFIANASHELRTPLALNRALLEVAVARDGATPEVRQLGETLLEINSRHERLIDGLLLLARSERELTDLSFVDLADVVDHVVAQLPAGPVTVHTAAAEAPTAGNAVLLERLVRNLVDNGLRYNVDSAGWVRVTTGTGPGGEAVLEVSNTGPVVPHYSVATLFEPFRRLGPERLSTASPGAGLGMSIVRAVARAHGGDVRAEPRDGGGLVVTVTLPPAAATVSEPDDAAAVTPG